MKIFDKRYHTPGTHPGTLAIDESLRDVGHLFHLISYSADDFDEKPDATLADCQASLSLSTQTWLHVQGTAMAESLGRLGELFSLHALALEDVINSGQRPKIDVHEDHLFTVFSLPVQREQEVGTVQVSLFLGKDYLISFCDGTADPFEPVRGRLRNHAGKLRTHRLDYLLYALIDVVIDGAFPILETLGDDIEALENEVLSHATQSTLNAIHLTKRELLLLRRTLWPHREVINALIRDDEGWIEENTKLYLRDCYDHTVQIMDLVDNCREMTSALLEVYLSSVSNRLNDVMRVLTIIATIFIPLTFLVGVYGMNFTNPDSPWSMPELRAYYGYPLLWLVMLTLVVVMLFLFRRNKWL